jgi:serine/threonine protein kinase
LQQYKIARIFLLNGFNKCGSENKELKQLEQQLTDLTGVPARPRVNDFEFIEELGTGNFTQIYKAEYKPTGKLYAIKVSQEYFLTNKIEIGNSPLRFPRCRQPK